MKTISKNRNKRHKIANCVDFNQNEIVSFTKPTLLTLNEYCISEIMEYLPTTDLLNLSVLDDSLLRIVKISLHRKTFNFTKIAAQKPNQKMSLSEVQIIFQTFGSFMTKIKINADDVVQSYRDGGKDRHLLDLICQYCVTDRLQALTLRQFTISRDFIRANCQLLRSIQYLTVDRCTIADECIAALFNNCWNLKKLKMCQLRNINNINMIPSQHLETVILKNCGNYAEEYLYRIIEHQPNLKRFKQTKPLSDVRRIPYENFTKFLPNVEILSINWFNRRYKNLLNLPHLKEIHIMVEERNMYPFIQFITELSAQSSIDTLYVKLLTFSFGSFNRSYKYLAIALARFKSLRKLRLDGIGKMNPYLSLLAENLTELEELQIILNESITTKDLISLISKMEKLKRLYLIFTPFIDLGFLFNHLMGVWKRCAIKQRFTIFVADKNINLDKFKDDYIKIVYFPGRINF